MSDHESTTPNTAPIIGIDLGTTNCVVAVVIDGQARVITSASGESLVPSVVAIHDGKTVLVGEQARNGQVAFPHKTISSVKRRMGEAVQLPLGDETFAPHEVSAMLLRYLKTMAETFLEFSVTRAVITVPAFFDENQRQATREAGQLAGLTVERIINEPTAATLAYQANESGQEIVAVYDLGGGTFDVSIVRIEDGVVEVLSSKGDTKLGGDDFDSLLLDLVADAFLAEHEIDLRADPSTKWRLVRACEEAKKALSSQVNVRITEEFVAEKDGQPLSVDMEISREEYEELISSLIDQTIGCVDQAISDAGLAISDVTQLILVGGSTRTPLVQEKLRSSFNLDPLRTLNPDTSVALGAANQGAKLAGLDIGPLLVDVATHTLGIAALGYDDAGPHFSPIIRRNSPMPVVHQEAFFTYVDGQLAVNVEVYQGESRQLSQNSKLGEFELKLSPELPRNSRILVRFSLTLDGTLQVVATEHVSGKSKELSLDNALASMRNDGRKQAEARLLQLYGTSTGVLSDGPPLEAEFVPLRGAAGEETVMEELNESVGDLTERAAAAIANATEEDQQDIRELLADLALAVAADDQDAITELRSELDDILFYVEA
jgi:molecular chaperone DnaK